MASEEGVLKIKLLLNPVQKGRLMAGDKFSGQLEIVSIDNVPIESVRIRVRCKEETRLSTAYQHSGKENHTDQVFHEKKKHCDITKVILPKGNIQVGKKLLPFEFELPETLPSSGTFDPGMGWYGTCGLSIRAYIDFDKSSGKKSLKATTSDLPLFSYVPKNIFDKNAFPALTQLSSKKGSLGKGFIDAEVNLNTPVIVAGQEFDVEVLIKKQILSIRAINVYVREKMVFASDVKKGSITTTIGFGTSTEPIEEEKIGTGTSKRGGLLSGFSKVEEHETKRKYKIHVKPTTLNEDGSEAKDLASGKTFDAPLIVAPSRTIHPLTKDTIGVLPQMDSYGKQMLLGTAHYVKVEIQLASLGTSDMFFQFPLHIISPLQAPDYVSKTTDITNTPKNAFKRAPSNKNLNSQVKPGSIQPLADSHHDQNDLIDLSEQLTVSDVNDSNSNSNSNNNTESGGGSSGSNSKLLSSSAPGSAIVSNPPDTLNFDGVSMFVQVNTVNNLLNSDDRSYFGNFDAFCRLEITYSAENTNPPAQKTPVVKGSKNTTFNHRFTVPIDKKLPTLQTDKRKIKISVCERDEISGDRVIGVIELGINEFYQLSSSSSDNSFVIQIYSPQSHTDKVGEISMKINKPVGINIPSSSSSSSSSLSNATVLTSSGVAGTPPPFNRMSSHGSFIQQGSFVTSSQSNPQTVLVMSGGPQQQLQQQQQQGSQAQLIYTGQPQGSPQNALLRQASMSQMQMQAMQGMQGMQSKPPMSPGLVRQGSVILQPQQIQQVQQQVQVQQVQSPSIQRQSSHGQFAFPVQFQ